MGLLRCTAWHILILLIITPLLTVPLLSVAQGLATDFDQDGKSDFTTVVIESSGALTWRSLNPSSGVATSRGTLGTVGQQIILANWIESNKPVRGVVSSNSSSALIWQIADGNGGTIQRNFGVADSLAISGGDFDGNGVADAATASVSAGKVNWTVSLNLFSLPQDSQSIKKNTLGSDLSTAFYAAARKGKDWLGSLVRLSNGKSILKFKDLINGKLIQSSSFPALTSRPFPIRHSNGADIIGFSVARGSNTLLEFRSTAGRLLRRILVPSSGDVVVGDFTNAPGEEVAVKSSTSNNYFVINPVSKKLTQIVGQQGIAVDSINLNSIAAAQPISNPTTPINGEVSCSTIVDIGSAPNILFKNENVHGGRGRTWLDQDRQEKGVRKLSVAGLNGKVFACFGLYRCDSPYGCRYYQAMCGDPLGNADFLSAALQNSDGQPYAIATSGNGKCYKFRADVTRYGSVRK